MPATKTKAPPVAPVVRSSTEAQQTVLREVTSACPPHDEARGVSLSDLRERTPLSVSQIHRALSALRRKGSIVYLGAASSTRYYLPHCNLPLTLENTILELAKKRGKEGWQMAEAVEAVNGRWKETAILERVQWLCQRGKLEHAGETSARRYWLSGKKPKNYYVSSKESHVANIMAFAVSRGLRGFQMGDLVAHLHEDRRILWHVIRKLVDSGAILSEGKRAGTVYVDAATIRRLKTEKKTKADSKRKESR